MRKTALNMTPSKALAMAFLVTLGISVSACSGDKGDEVMAVDRVDAAAELARKNGPEAEDMGFSETAPMVTTDAEEVTAAADMPITTDTVAATVPVTDSPIADDAAEPEGLAANAGKQLYETQCVACHGTGLLGAPKFGNAADWAPRIAKDKETLYMHAAKGFNQMPAQATNGVTEAQIHAAVDYMVAAAS